MLAILGSGVMLCHEVKMSPECLIELEKGVFHSSSRARSWTICLASLQGVLRLSTPESFLRRTDLAHWEKYVQQSIITATNCQLLSIIAKREREQLFQHCRIMRRGGHSEEPDLSIGFREGDGH
jgi:hypothetical protein